MEEIPTVTPTVRFQRFRAKERAADLEGYRSKGRISRNAWAAKNRDHVNETHRGTIAKAKVERRFYCAVCDSALQSPTALKQRLATQSHADRVAGIVKPEPSKYAVNTRVQGAENKDNKLHQCSTCDKSFDTDWALSRHKATPQHMKKEDAIAA